MSFGLYNIKTKKIEQIPPEMVMDRLYYLEYILPPNLPPKELTKLKQDISKLKYKIPLYDIGTTNMYIISKSELYERVINQNFRFPDKTFLSKLKKKIQQKTSDFYTDENLLKRRDRKFQYIIEFLNNFDLDILYRTYIECFYETEQISKNISVCVRPSYLPHMKHVRPYYNTIEIIKLAKNNNLDTNLEISLLCDIVAENDIPASILLQHLEHISKNKQIGLVQYYTFHGSFFFNKYLRNVSQSESEFKNIILEENILAISKLIKSAPAFDKDYILYRFIETDDHINNFKPGDIYIEPGFTSTTRDPFYTPTYYKFGMILVKIKIPANMMGIALCVETYSLFPQEEEIILAPYLKLRLDARDNNVDYYHIDETRETHIRTRYEFTFVGYDECIFTQMLMPTVKPTLDLKRFDKAKGKSLSEKIINFVNTYVNNIFQFKIKLLEITLTLSVEWSDSTGSYRNMYSIRKSDNFGIYCLHDNHILVFIEIGDIDGIPNMHVNYFLKYTSTPRKTILDKENFLYLISAIAHQFGIEQVKIYTDYVSCDYDFNVNKHRGGNFCLDFYEYFKYGKKIYPQISTNELHSGFSYYKLDILKKTKINEIIKKDTIDDFIYQLYDKTYKQISNEDNLAAYYVWLVETNCYIIPEFIKKISKLYLADNPFDYDYYIFYPITYLYNKNILPLFTQNDISLDNTYSFFRIQK